MIDKIAADPLPFLYIAAYYTAVVYALAAGLATFKQSLDRRVIKERERAESARLGITFRRDYTYRRTEPTWLRTSMQQRRAA